MATVRQAFVTIDDNWAYSGHRTVVLENDRIRLEIMPELGAKVFRFVHRASGIDPLWHNPRIEPRAVSIGASYDDNFSGGWDELFPNDAAGVVGDAVYPDHGELWSQPWTCRITRADATGVEVHLRRAGAASATIVEKWISLAPGDASALFRHRITNVGTRRLDFLWKLHPALAIDAGDRIDVPGRVGELVDPGFGRISAPREFTWPIASPAGMPAVDFSTIPELDGGQDFLYVRGLSAGWCALRRVQHGVGFGLAFSPEVFTNVWLFMTYGGWRGYRTLVLEPCTTWPKDLVAAIRARQCASLEAGASLETEIRAVAFDGISAVRSIGMDGVVAF